MGELDMERWAQLTEHESFEVNLYDGQQSTNLRGVPQTYIGVYVCEIIIDHVWLTLERVHRSAQASDRVFSKNLIVSTNVAILS